MTEFDDENGFVLNSLDVIVPKGWKVISHGTSFHKWRTPMPGHPAQDLQQLDEVVVHDTVDNGLTCVDEKNDSLLLLYTGSNEPVILRILVPFYGPDFDAKTLKDAYRFLKPDQMKDFLVPKDTILKKIGETEGGSFNLPPVIWYVPKQFLSLFERDVRVLQADRATGVMEADKGTSGFDIADSFAAFAGTEEHIVEPADKPDEYFENLEEQLQADVEAEVAAEERKSEKRAKDKAKARARDKENAARAERTRETNI